MFVLHSASSWLHVRSDSLCHKASEEQNGLGRRTYKKTEEFGFSPPGSRPLNATRSCKNKSLTESPVCCGFKLPTQAGDFQSNINTHYQCFPRDFQRACRCFCVLFFVLRLSKLTQINPPSRLTHPQCRMPGLSK